eukprot:6967197-Pyramimonas_sp.AAC.1
MDNHRRDMLKLRAGATNPVVSDISFPPFDKEWSRVGLSHWREFRLDVQDGQAPGLSHESNATV